MQVQCETSTGWAGVPFTHWREHRHGDSASFRRWQHLGLKVFRDQEKAAYALAVQRVLWRKGLAPQPLSGVLPVNRRLWGFVTQVVAVAPERWWAVPAGDRFRAAAVTLSARIGLTDDHGDNVGFSRGKVLLIDTEPCSFGRQRLEDVIIRLEEIPDVAVAIRRAAQSRSGVSSPRLASPMPRVAPARAVHGAPGVGC